MFFFSKVQYSIIIIIVCWLQLHDFGMTLKFFSSFVLHGIRQPFSIAKCINGEEVFSMLQSWGFGVISQTTVPISYKRVEAAKMRTQPHDSTRHSDTYQKLIGRCGCWWIPRFHREERQPSIRTNPGHSGVGRWVLSNLDRQVVCDPLSWYRCAVRTKKTW